MGFPHIFCGYFFCSATVSCGFNADSKQWKSKPCPLPNFVHGVLNNILPLGDMSILIHALSLNIKPTPIPTTPTPSGQLSPSKKRKFCSVINEDSLHQAPDITDTSTQPSSSQITLAPSEDDTALRIGSPPRGFPFGKQVKILFQQNFGTCLRTRTYETHVTFKPTEHSPYGKLVNCSVNSSEFTFYNHASSNGDMHGIKKVCKIVSVLKPFWVMPQ